MDKAWKAEERRVAKMFCTERRLMKGTGEVRDIGGEDYPLCLDVKLRKKKNWRVRAWIRKLTLEAAAITLPDDTSPVPIVCVRRPHKQKRYAILPLSYIRPLLKRYQRKLYLMGRQHESQHWRIEEWHKELREKAQLRIAVVVVKDTDGELYAIMMAYQVASILKGCGIIGEETN